jgi:hypothetical protein
MTDLVGVDRSKCNLVTSTGGFMRTCKIMLASLLIAGTIPGLTAPVLAQASAAAQPAHYSVDKTLVGKLLDDPAAAAILEKLIPTVFANDMFQTAGRDLTLKDIQQYEPQVLNNDNLAKIQAELDKIPAKD